MSKDLYRVGLKPVDGKDPVVEFVPANSLAVTAVYRTKRIRHDEIATMERVDVARAELERVAR